jgi:hypothetical protein
VTLYEDDEQHAELHAEPRRWWLQTHGGERKATSPLLHSARLKRNKYGEFPLWEGRVIEAGTTPSQDPWMLFAFEGMGSPYSQRRREEVVAVFIELHRFSTEVRVQLAVVRFQERASVDDAYVVFRYGPFMFNAAVNVNKWARVVQIVDKVLPLYMKSPLAVEHSIGLPHGTFEKDTLRWLHENRFFEEMERGLHGADVGAS